MLRAAFLFALSLTLVPAATLGGGIPGTKCTAAKHAAYGRYVGGVQACRAKARKNGGPLDVRCLERNESKLAKALANAEKKDDCVQLGNAALAQRVAELFADQLDEVIEESAVCCEITGRCAYVPDAAACATRSGTLGPEGSTCDGNGQCVTGPAFPGTCCTAEGICATGPVTEGECDTFGGSFEESALCLPTQRCLAIP
jgi:hypothetical protein